MENGLPEGEVIALLEKMKKKDLSYDRIFSSMCTDPHPIAVKAYIRFIESNLGDAGLFPGTKSIECKVVKMLGSILGNPKAFGYMTTGGTESNIQAIRAARNLAGKDRPNIVVSESGHFSFDKLSDILRLEVRKADLDEGFRVDIGSVEDLIDENTVSLVGIAGTTEFGQIDPIEDLSRIAEREGLFLHVDAAFGGLVIPFLEKEYKFGFELDGVSSMTIDPHKMGMCTIPSGGLLFRERRYLRSLSISTPYLSTKAQFSLTGTRSGGAVVGTYAVFKHLGYDGLKKNARRCVDLARMFVEKAEEFGVYPMVDPVMNVLALDVPKIDKVLLMLLMKGWRVSVTRRPRALRLVIMPHSTEENVNLLLEDLKEIVKKVF
ncbi:MAG: tyrosine decarboxylase MfnA [Halobacteriota archaeon]|nr:tyrosine decarboxylase MfnA [Halobacteriota archaeon]